MMRPLSFVLTLALPLFSQQTPSQSDAPTQVLSHPAGVQTQFLQSHPTFTPMTHQEGALLFRDSASSKSAAIVGAFTHQDPTTGAWVANDASLSATANGWRLDGTAYSVFVRQSGAAQHVISQTFTDYATKHASTLNLTVPTLTYSKDLTFGFKQDGLAWTLSLTGRGFFEIGSVVSKRIGKATHSFPVTSSEDLTIDSLGELLGDTHIGLTRAVMIPRYGSPIPCSAWNYSNGVASFTCDDSVLKDNQLPYTIDPQSMVTLTDPGGYSIDSWCDNNGNCGHDNAVVNFDTSSVVPATSTVLGTDCSFNVESADGGVGCNVSQAYSAGGTGQVTVSVGFNDGTLNPVYSVSAAVDTVQFIVTFNPPPAAAAPTFSIGDGTYPQGTAVSMSTTTSGASIHYTTDGSAPSTTNGTLYTGPVALLSPSILQAVAYGSQWTTSPVTSHAYSLTVATPSFTVAPGVYTSSIRVGISMSNGNGMTSLPYTTDGSTPTPSSANYLQTGPITVPLNTTMTINAIAFGLSGNPGYPGWVNSSVASATYTVTGAVAAPAFSIASGTYTTAQSVTLSSGTSGATIRYTTDGSTPSETHGTVYSGAISVASSVTIEAIAYETNWIDSSVSSASYTITGTVVAPSISPAAGTYASAQSVSLSTSTAGASIRYTLDGSTPTETSGTLYQGPFTLANNSNAQAAAYTVKAIAYESGWNDSAVASPQITITGTVGAPIFTPSGGIYSASQSVALSSVTSGATIRYTTDSSTPSETQGTVYTSPIPVTSQVVINAIAYESGWLDSAVTAETYYFQSPTGGTGSGGHPGPPPSTPPADSGNGLDPRRVGVRALGSYWGDAGENIDMNSGNLSFANPLIKPFGRGGWSLPFMLSYNSQMWRNDAGGDWLLGQDVGYGMGWKLQAGSLTPVWAGTSSIDHYIFADASGAEYNLTVNTGGVWTSLEGVYISYDSNANRLYNTNGSFWVMGCTSAGTEQDAGTMYPTLVQDTNGNQITINYQPGQGMGAANTSARISTIVDTRITYSFTYSLLSPNDDIQHLTSITGVLGESWLLTYTNASFNSPITGAPFGATELLSTLQQNWAGAGQPPAASFAYNGGAEMTQYTTPMGGSISWGYRSFTYAGNIALREINSRSMNQGAGGFTNSHGIWHNDSNDAGLTYHYISGIQDSGAGTEKIYYNAPAFSGSSVIAPEYYQEYQYQPAAAYPTLQKNFAWAQNGAGNVYLSELLNVLYTSASSYTYSTTLQTLDNYGNLTQQQVYDYGASSPTRTYNLTYLTDPNYINRYIRNRLTLATATANGLTTTLATSSYDGTTLGALQVPIGYVASTIPHHDAAYDTTFAYRGNITSSWKMGTVANYAYDIAGNPYLAQDGDGMNISIATNTSTAASLPSALTPNGNSNLTTSFTYSALFSPTSVTGANGATQSQQYDGYNRPSSTTSVDGAVTVYSYAFAPNTQTATISTTVNNTTTTQWRKTIFDGFGRTISVQTGHDGTTYNTVDTVYGACGCSPLGKLVKVSLPFGPGETEVWATYTYDASGRQLTSTAPDGSVTTTSYSGNSVTTTDPAGAWKTNVMDAFGNITIVTEPDPATGTTTSNSPVTSYTYNGANQLLGVSMIRGGITQNRTFRYIGSDLVSETTPEAGTVTYTYDGNHHVTQRTDALNQKTTYAYDGYERLTAVQHYTWGPNPYCTINCPNQWNEQPGQDVNYYYDVPVASDYTQNYTWGRLSRVVFGQQIAPLAFAYEYSYNQAGRISGNRMLVTNGGNGSVDIQAQYAWDNQGRMTSMTYPSGPVMNYQFDPMGRPSGMTGTSNSAYATYGTANQILTLGGAQQFPGGNNASMSETRTYNSMLQLTHLVGSAQGYTPAFQNPIIQSAGVDMQYTYNTGHNNGRVAQTIDNVLGETVNYTYDYLHRLTGATATNSSWGEAYAFDGYGNLTGKTPTVGTAPVFLGSAGSNATNGALPPNFDIENRLASSKSANLDTFSYIYDPWGRRVWKQDAYNNTGEAYFYGATGQKLETYSCSWGSTGTLAGSSEGINTYFAGKMLSEKGVFLATDRLGSVRGDSNGVSMSYFPWGEERGQGTPDNRTKFAGYFRDMPGQDYADARYYSATSGSFWSPDPGGISTADSKTPLSWNRSAYVQGDPVDYIDPGGTALCSPSACPCEWDPTLCGGSPTPPGGAPCAATEDEDSCGGDPGGGGGGGPDPFVCPAQYEAWINAHGADAVATGLSEANVLALSAIESGWGAGRFATQGNDFFNLETLAPKGWKPGAALPQTIYAYQVSWMNAKEAFASGRNKGRYSLVATYAKASDSFKSFAATLGSAFSGVTDAATFGRIAVAHGENGGKGKQYVDTANTFFDCLAAQKQ